MALKRLEEIRKIRLEKIKSLREAGINPYPSKVKGEYINVIEARKKLGIKVGVAGRLWGWRAHGNSIEEGRWIFARAEGRVVRTVQVSCAGKGPSLCSGSPTRSR